MTGPAKPAYGATRCDCCDLPAESCGRAVEQRQRADETRRKGELRARGWFQSQYPGSCGICGEPFGPGTYIRWTEDGWPAECCS